MIETKEKETEQERVVFVECATGLLNDEDEDEVTAAWSILDEIIDETESEDWGKEKPQDKPAANERRLFSND